MNKGKKAAGIGLKILRFIIRSKILLFVIIALPLIYVLASCVYVVLETDASYEAGDNSNVPYVVDSTLDQIVGEDKSSQNSSNSTNQGTSFTSLDGFLFIGDSITVRLGQWAPESNCTYKGVVSSSPAHWLNDQSVDGNATYSSLPANSNNIKGICIMLGTNGVNQSQEMKSLIEKIHSKYSDKPIFVQKILPCSSFDENARSTYNNEIKAFCDKNDYTTFIDATNGVTLDDGIHPDMNGCKTLASNIKNAILSTTISSGNIEGGDYIIKTDETGALPALTKEQLIKGIEYTRDNGGIFWGGSQGANNAIDLAGDFIKMEKTWKVNAVLAVAAADIESGTGTGWAAIDPSTHNIFSVRGSVGGGNNGWNVYGSFGEAVDAFGALLVHNYFPEGRYRVSDVAAIYNSDDRAAWTSEANKRIKSIYEGAGIKLPD